MRTIQFTIILFTLFLTACAVAPQKPISLTENFWDQQGQEKKIGIVMSQLPPVELQLPGAGCLLCMAVAAGANSSLQKHTKTLKYEGVRELKTVLKQGLEEKGIQVEVIEKNIYMKGIPKNKSKNPNSAKKDFSSIAKQNNFTHLLVIDIKTIGMVRTYSSYIPTADPKGAFIGSTYLVDANTNTYLLYEPIEIYRSANDQWDEPPSFPGLTNAFYQAVEMGKEAILGAYTKQTPNLAPADSESSNNEKH